MVNAAPIDETLLTTSIRNATNTIATIVHIIVNARSLNFCHAPAFKSCHRTVLGSSASETFNTCFPLNKYLGSETALVSFLSAFNEPTEREVKTFLWSFSVSKVRKILVTGKSSCASPSTFAFRATSREKCSGIPGATIARRRCQKFLFLSSCAATLARSSMFMLLPGSCMLAIVRNLSLRSNSVLTRKSLSTAIVQTVTWAPSQFS
mmetsp:Transcript_15075/g.24388  ORF Transcript_15075/g.24388 Transcript_15075/m.24388 type:complete len:207 (-) Transcript_15075:270-890(-)